MQEKYKHISRRFGESLKRELVKEIDLGQLSIGEVSRQYEVSRTSIRRWLEKYSLHYKKKTRVIVEKRSHQERLKDLESQLKDLKAMLGEKQIRIDYLEKLMELMGQAHDIDFEKKAEGLLSSGSDKTKEDESGR